MFLEKLLNNKIKFIYVYFILILFILLFVAFGWSVRHIYEGGTKLKKFESAIMNIASIPSNIKKLILGVDYDLIVSSGKTFKEKGINFFNKENLSGYLLISKYDGDKKTSVVEILDLENKKIIHRYIPNIDEINKKIPTDKNKYDLTKDFNRFRYRIIHPLIDRDGGMIFNSIYSPLIKVDICSNLEWFNTEISHHSNEFDFDGNIWTPATLSNSKFKGFRKKFIDDSVNKVSKDGKTLFSKSVIEILVDNNLDHLIGDASDDPIHLNDVQPTISDTDYWNKDDLFLSLRELSLILLYRPSTNKIIWYQQYPWVFQHDVDIINDKEIMIFNNNLDWSKTKVNGLNEINVYNFETDKTYNILEKNIKELELSTKSEGLIDQVGNYFMIEETGSGRLVIMNKKKEVFTFINNNYENNNNYTLNWSRYYDESFVNIINIINKKKEKCRNN